MTFPVYGVQDIPVVPQSDPESNPVPEPVVEEVVDFNPVTPEGQVVAAATEVVSQSETVVSEDDSLMAGVEKIYSTNQAAEFFGKSNQWLYWGLRNNIFTDVDGKPIEPVRIGKGQRRRFTLPIIREIALACYRRGNLKEDELKAILRKIIIAEQGESSFDAE